MRHDLFTLGTITAGFHQASASDPSQPAFAPTPIASSDVRDCVATVASDAARAIRQVWDSSLAEDKRARLVRALTRVSAADASVVPPIDYPATSFAGIRIHGDYHLGQTLKTTSGFVLIDFEGEPGRSIEERRRKRCALKDVAGMLRSFEYALAVACEGAPDRIDGLRADLRMAAAFLDGYFTAAGTASSVFLPADPEARARWIRFFEIDKALYELDYELNNRPEWAHIPARGLLRLLDA
jgi:trehalose synthase-fused probable maltokinase